MAMECYESILFGIGCFAVVLFAPKTLAYLVSLVCRPCRKNLLVPRENDWAIVTGATDGIGLEYARQLAAKGYNLLLLSRTESKLDSVRKRLMEVAENSDIETLAVDFTRTDIYPAIEEKIQSLEGRISVLVSNVGMMSQFPYEFAEPEDPELNTKILICNTLSVLRMAEIVLPRMKKQRQGVVINVSSAIALAPIPLFSTYAATKCFVSSLSSTLAAEYAQYGITVQDITPNQVETNLSQALHTSALAVDTKSYVTYALNAVNRESQSSAHPKHKIINNISLFVDFWLPKCWTMSLKHNFAKSYAQKNSNNNN